MAKIALDGLRFDNRTLRELPVDPVQDHRPRQVRGACFSRVSPAPLERPRTVAVSRKALALLDLSEEEVHRSDFPEYLCGNKILPGAEPAAHCYCGHQFGYFSGQLGDGAAMYLGEVVNSAGERWELQFKGAGLTPYSRSADGRKVLRSSLREFLCCEAMHHLGVPTTRAGTVVTSDTRVVRDILYDGNAIQERATVITRIAPSFLRFGTFEIFKSTDTATGRAGPSAGLEGELLPVLLDFTVRHLFPNIWCAHTSGDVPPEGSAKEDMYLEFYKEVVRRTAVLVAHWQAVGWCHGVLNTDNMSIVGVTLDYGPFGFMERYDPDFVPNGSDDAGRYDFKSQPEICRWNCERLAEALAPALPLARSRAELHALWDITYETAYMRLMRAKLGLVSSSDRSDKELVDSLLQTMTDTGADFTRTFRSLSLVPLPDSEGAVDEQLLDAAVTALCSTCASAATMTRATKSRIPPENLQMLATLAARDPAVLHSLGIDQKFLATEQERARTSAKWAGTSDESKAASDAARWREWVSRYVKRLAREQEAGTEAQGRAQTMALANPWLVLRNWVAQVAIERAEAGDFAAVAEVLSALEEPYGELPACRTRAALQLDGPSPTWAEGLIITCSS